MEVLIERIIPGGFGLAHAEGRTIMVALAVPGDRLRVRVEREKGSVCFASIVEVIEASPHRIEPPCPYFGRCGGCDFQQMNYRAQLDAKIEILKDCLHRIAKIQNIPDFKINPAPSEWHYRSRAQWQYDADQKALGYYESGSRRVCDVAECAVLAPPLQTALEEVRQVMANSSLPEGARYFRAVAGDQSVAVSADVSPVSLGSGNSVMRRTIHGETYTLSADSFFQTNLELLPQLINAALGKQAGETAIELYCGVGLFTFPLARRFKQVTAVEGDSDAAEFARKNLVDASLHNVCVETADVGKWINLECGGRAQQRRRFGSLPQQSSEGPERTEQIQGGVAAGALQIDFLLLDPPRTGAESLVINGILQLRPKRICYVSCDPATLARDLKKLIAGRYSLDTIAAFDMFPQTHHVETVVNLTAP